MAVLSLFLALLLALSAGHKIVARVELGPVAARLAGVSANLGTTLLFTAATAEGLAALALFLPPLAPAGALAAAAIWTGYTTALWRHRGETLDCGCDLVRRVRPVTAVSAARPAMLVALALLVANAPNGPMTVETPFAALALLALWFAAAELAALPSWRRA